MDAVVHFLIKRGGDFQVPLSGQAKHQTWLAWITLHIAGGHIALPILVLTFLFSRARRHSTLINMCLTWILTSIISLLLLYAGQYQAPQPARGLCVAQGALVFALPPMVSLSAFGVMYHVWFTVRGLGTVGATQRESFAQTVTLLSLPYVAFVLFSIAGLVLAFAHPEQVALGRRVLYCSIFNNTFTDVSALVTAAACLATLGLEVRILIVLRRNWSGLRAGGNTDRGFDLQFISRVVVFGLYVLLGFVISILTIFIASAASDIFVATVPIVVFLVFGLSPDVLRVWTLRNRPRFDISNPVSSKTSLAESA